MKPVERHEIVDFVTYEDERDRFRSAVIKAKASRRVHLGDDLTLLFENPMTVRYQIQEMIRTERIVREADIQHEIRTYNELLGRDGELGCTLLIEISDPLVRGEKLKEWWALPEHLYALLEDGTRISAGFDERQRGDGKLSAVQYLRFDTGGRVPVALGVDMPQLTVETTLTGIQKEALQEDLAL